jgi:hypothetical protein
MHEYIGNLHLHSTYSDGNGTYPDLARAAIEAGLDFLVVTDHNIWPQGMDGYRHMGDGKVLVLAGEEVHDAGLNPQKNHLLAYEAGRELASLAPNPQHLIDAIRQSGGLSFIAHPNDPPGPVIKEPGLTWEDWDVEGFTGIEIWNYMSEFKGLMTSRWRALWYAYQPLRAATGPDPDTLEKWDQLLMQGKRIVGLGGSDAHAIQASMGPLKRVIFPYRFMFNTVNTHVLLDEPLIGDAQKDRQRLFDAIRAGRCFVGYDLPHSTRGFRFSAQADNAGAVMGDEISPRLSVTLQIRAPLRCRLKLIRHGEVLREWSDTETAVLTVNEPGAYRAEAHLYFKGRERAWIFSNPIYVRR